MEQENEHTPAAPAIARRRITEAGHGRFAAFSGDLNPLHVDAEAARNMEPGGLLAYGMDLLLWALESLASARQLPANLTRVRTRFLKWVFLEDEVALHRCDKPGATANRFEASVNGAAVMTLELFEGARSPCSLMPALPPAERRRQPRNPGRGELEGQQGLIALPSLPEAEEAYPALAARLGPAAICEMAGCSYVIGMEAPGLYSMSVRYDLSLCEPEPDAVTALHYRVSAADPRFRNVTICVQGAHVSGTLEALVRTV